jgi:hypothetical protein
VLTAHYLTAVCSWSVTAGRHCLRLGLVFTSAIVVQVLSNEVVRNLILSCRSCGFILSVDNTVDNGGLVLDGGVGKGSDHFLSHLAGGYVFYASLTETIQSLVVRLLQKLHQNVITRSSLGSWILPVHS